MNFNLILNPLSYFIRRYHSADLKSDEARRMLNLWFPFIFNRIKVEYISDDFTLIDVRLKHSIWNRNPNKSLWGGAIFSAADGFFPLMLKQNALIKGIQTDFFTKSTTVNYLREAKTDLIFSFQLKEKDIELLINSLKKEGRYQKIHTIYGINTDGQKCIEANIQPYLRLRKMK